MAISGLGRLLFANDDVVYYGRLNTFQFTDDKSIAEVLGYPFVPGPLQTVDTRTTKDSYKLTVGTGSFDRNDFQFIFDEIAQTSATVTLPEATIGTIPSVSTYTITVTGLTIDQVVQVSSIDIGTETFFTQVANTATPTAGEFKVTANTLTFAAADAGKQVVIHYLPMCIL